LSERRVQNQAQVIRRWGCLRRRWAGCRFNQPVPRSRCLVEWPEPQGNRI